MLGLTLKGQINLFLVANATKSKREKLMKPGHELKKNINVTILNKYGLFDVNCHCL